MLRCQQLCQKRTTRQTSPCENVNMQCGHIDANLCAAVCVCRLLACLPAHDAQTPLSFVQTQALLVLWRDCMSAHAQSCWKLT
jgi:hypothetical protein